MILKRDTFVTYITRKKCVFFRIIRRNDNKPIKRESKIMKQKMIIKNNNEFNLNDVKKNQIVLDLKNVCITESVISNENDEMIVVLSKRDYKNLQTHVKKIKQTPSLLKLNSLRLDKVYEMYDDTITYYTMLMMNRSISITESLQTLIQNIHFIYNDLNSILESEMN